MHAKRRQSGLTLTEMAVVVAVITLLAGLSLPAVKMVTESFESGSSAKSMISSALATARALAAKEGHYVGVRFQHICDSDPSNPLNPLETPQYMTLIIHDQDILAGGFRAIEGAKPMKLPDSVSVMDFTVVTRYYPPSLYVPTITENKIDDGSLVGPIKISQINDVTTFSIVFSPSGKLVTQKVQIRNRHGLPDTISNNRLGNDDVFNKKVQVDAGIGMFYQDDYCGAHFSPYPDYGLGPEFSRRGFLIFDKARLRKAFNNALAWSDYVPKIVGKMTYINPHTGTIIQGK